MIQTSILPTPSTSRRRSTAIFPRPGSWESISSTDKWDLLFQQTVSFAQYQIERLRWRGDFDGVLPHGFDANSIASQATLELLEKSDIDPQAGPQSVDDTLWQLKRSVLRHVNRLYHLRENRILSNQADLAPVQDQDNEWVNPLELIPAPDVPPDDALIRKESLLAFAHRMARFDAFLHQERRLKRLFQLIAEGISKPQDLAARLKLGVRTIDNLRQRLQRRWNQFLGPRVSRKRGLRH
jgi:hypothetical protein